MERLLDPDICHWIESGLVPPHQPFDKAIGNFVSGCVPPIFEAYAKIFHPIFEDPTSERDGNWDEVERAKPVGTTHVEQVLANMGGRTVFMSTNGDESYDWRVTWKELARRYDLAYHPELNVASLFRAMPGGSFPSALVGPSEGSLDEPHSRRLAHLLANGNQSVEATFYFNVLASWSHTSAAYVGRLFDVAQLLALPEMHASPEYWWPENKSWLVCSDYDLTFTLVGGTRAIVDSLLRDSLLEAVEILPTHRVDWGSDQINVSRTETGSAT